MLKEVGGQGQRGQVLSLFFFFFKGGNLIQRPCLHNAEVTRLRIALFYDSDVASSTYCEPGDEARVPQDWTHPPQVFCSSLFLGSGSDLEMAASACFK